MMLCKVGLSAEAAAVVTCLGSTVVIMVLISIVYMISSRKKKRRAAEEQAALKQRFESEYKKWSTSVVVNNGLKPISSDMCLATGERCFYSAEAVLYEPRSVRSSTHIGGGVRVAKGVVVGGGNTWSESHDEWRELSSGTLYVTNKRIFFDGEMHDRTVKFSALTKVQAGIQELTISCSTRQKTMVFGGINARIAQDTIRLLQKASIGR